MVEPSAETAYASLASPPPSDTIPSLGAQRMASVWDPVGIVLKPTIVEPSAERPRAQLSSYACPGGRKPSPIIPSARVQRKASQNPPALSYPAAVEPSPETARP